MKPTLRGFRSLLLCLLPVASLAQAPSLDTPDEDLTPWQPCPYPASDVITGISFDPSTRQTHAPGSDIWPITWADDGNQYTAWGDGAGFGGERNSSKAEGRVSLGVARIEGPAETYRGVNVWGGFDAESPATFEGKGTGLLCVDGALYMMVGGPRSLTAGETRPAVSRDHGHTWTLAGWKWTLQDRIHAGVFLNFGQDYAGARDGFVYVYFTHIQTMPPDAQPRNWIHEKPGRVDLARVPKDQILVQEAYSWFSGLDASGAPEWTAEIAARASVFEDPNGLKVVSASFNPPLRRYLMLYNQKNNAGNLALFEALETWGPWHNVAYLRGESLFMPPESNRRVSIYHFAPKWWSANGLDFTLVFNTGDDQWNTIQGRLDIANPDNLPATN